MRIEVTGNIIQNVAWLEVHSQVYELVINTLDKGMYFNKYVGFDSYNPDNLVFRVGPQELDNQLESFTGDSIVTLIPESKSEIKNLRGSLMTSQVKDQIICLIIDRKFFLQSKLISRFENK